MNWLGFRSPNALGLVIGTLCGFIVAYNISLIWDSNRS